MIKQNLYLVRQNIAQAARKSGRGAEDVTLVCVTKEATIGQIEEAVDCGVTDIGENRVQEALEKSLKLKAENVKLNIKFHLIGHLQTNKVKKAVEIFDLIHSVDSFRLAQEISREAAKISKVQDILIQVNIAAEPSKFGIKPEETTGLIKQITALNNIKILGLMAIAPLADDPDDARPYFKKLRQLSVSDSWQAPGIKQQWPVLSMGMSNDYQVAIEEGATMVRIGSAIFSGYFYG